MKLLNGLNLTNMDKIDLIERKIKELYDSKASFCAANDYKYKDFASKLRTVESRINWLNNFLHPLGLEIQIALKKQSAEEKIKKTEPDNAD